jgi:ABC-type dipeptide/oligopeptide/nickel transport system permease subunit
MLDNGTFPQIKLPQLMTDIAQGLAALHGAKVVFRELAPSRVIVADDDGRAVLTDFELAKLTDTAPTVSANWPGDPYQAPEVSGGTADETSDLYSWAQILLHVAAGELPTKGCETDLLNRLALPKSVWKVTSACLSPGPTDRPCDVQTVLRAIAGMTNAQRNYFIRLNGSLAGLLSTEGVSIAVKNPETAALEETASIVQSDYVNVNQIPNVRILPLGTDNFGRDVLTELVAATRVSLWIGFVAGIIATLIGLVLGLVSGYIGGFVDDGIMFVTNLFTVIPSFVLLILISFSIGQEQRGAFIIAVVIGATSWVWTARAVRSQVISLRNRDHVNLSKLSGHSITHIILRDILPYIASYVVMALILQISSGILAEAGLSILGLGPKTTEVPTLGLMMNWAMIYQAHILGKWWAYFPVILVIALIAFSMNLMNTGLDQVFNPALRD